MTNQLDELLKTRATLAEALVVADDPASPEVAELKRALNAIDELMAPIVAAEREATDAKVRLEKAQLDREIAPYLDRAEEEAARRAEAIPLVDILMKGMRNK